MLVTLHLNYEKNKCDNNLFFFALTRNIGDLFLDVFDCITHAGWQRATLIQKTAHTKQNKKDKKNHFVFNCEI